MKRPGSEGRNITKCSMANIELAGEYLNRSFVGLMRKPCPGMDDKKTVLIQQMLVFQRFM